MIVKPFRAARNLLTMIVKPFRTAKYGTQMTQIRQMATDFFVANAMHFPVTLSEVEGSLNASYVISSLLRDPSTAVGMTWSGGQDDVEWRSG